MARGVARTLCTGAALAVAALGFFGGGSPIAPLNPLGILFLMISGAVWFGWEMIGDAYAYREEICPNRGRAFLQTARLGPVLVNRLITDRD